MNHLNYSNNIITTQDTSALFRNQEQLDIEKLKEELSKLKDDFNFLNNRFNKRGYDFVDGVLHNEFGSIMFGDAYRDIGKTTGIIDRLLINNKALMIVGYSHFIPAIKDKLMYEKNLSADDIMVVMQRVIVDKSIDSLRGRIFTHIYLDEASSEILGKCKAIFPDALIRGFIR